MKYLVLAVCLILLAPALAWSHPGNVDEYGCHYDRKTMTRHCHPERKTQRNKPGPGAGGNGGGYSRPYSGGRGYTPSSRGGAQGFYSPPPSSDWDGGYRKPKPNQKFIDNIRRKSNMVQTGGPTGPAQAATEPKVTDGDTLQITLDGRRVTARLYGIDAPEGKQPGGDASTAALRKLVAGQRLAIVPYGQDRYGRMLIVLYTNALGKKTVNQAMVEKGHAWYFERYCTSGMCDSWRQSEQSARQAKRGIWAKANPIAPWDWRAGERGGKSRQAAAGNKPQPPQPARSGDATLRNSTFACRSIDDALRIHETLERGNLNAATATMKRMIDGGKCAYLPDGADVDVLGAAKDHEFFKLVRPAGSPDSWWVMQDSLARR